MASAVIARADELTRLDQAIGDGDHGTNMRRGMEAVLATLPELRRMPLPEALVSIGTTLVTSVGGAAGPLFGTFFLTLGRRLPAGERAENPVSVARAAQPAVDAVKARGRSEEGDKTLLDVLGPVCRALAEGVDGDALALVATEAAERTISMRAQRGRAAFLGPRSVGHMDPGACSVAIMVTAAVESLARVGECA